MRKPKPTTTNGYEIDPKRGKNYEQAEAQVGKCNVKGC